MDDFLGRQANLDPVGLYHSPDGGLSLIPAGPNRPGEQESNDELGLLSSSNPAPPLQHPDIREPLQEEYPRLRDPHLVYTCPPVSTGGPSDIEPYQRASFSYAFDNGSLTESLCVRQGISVHGFRSQQEWHRALHLQSRQGIWDIDHSPMTLPVQRKPPHDTEMGQDSNPSCPACGKKFYAMKAVNRHWDDLHSIPQKCPFLNCNEMLTGNRKLQSHLRRHHKGVSPS